MPTLKSETVAGKINFSRARLRAMHKDRIVSELYRPNVGIVLFNRDGFVLVARRIGDDGPEIITLGCEWQFPQGGVDPHEDLDAAARRELWEETGVTSAEMLGHLPSAIRYDFPPYPGPPHRLARFRGQEQRWVAMRFTGDESEIDLGAAGDAADPEFDAWRWERLERVVDLVVPYKRHVYVELAREFARFGAGQGRTR